MITIKTKRPGKLFWLHSSLPQTYQEMTRKQALAFASMLMVRQCHFDQSFTVEDKLFFIGLLLSLSGVSTNIYYDLGDLAVSQMVEEMGDFFSGDHAHPCIKYLLVGGKKHALPKYGLHGTSFFQFTMAEEFYANIADGQDFESNLINLAAILTGASDKKIVRALTTDNNTPGRWRKILNAWKSTTEAELYAVLYWYRHTRETLREQYPAVFTSAPSTKGVDFTSKYRWTAVHEELSGKAFGTWQDLAATDVHKVLHHINYFSDKFKELEINGIINGG